MTRARRLGVTGRPDPRRLERQLAAALALAGLPAPVPQFRFAPPRQWKADFAWPEARLLVEVDGGVFTRGRHTRGTGYIKDCEKLNAAVLAGWRVLRVTPPDLRSGRGVAWIAQALAVGPAPQTNPAGSPGAPQDDPPVKPPRTARSTASAPPGLASPDGPSTARASDDQVSLTRDVVRSACAAGLRVRASRRGGVR